MTRTYYRTVSTSAEPSRANWDDDQPRACTRCNTKLRITVDSFLWFRRYPVLESFCAGCSPKHQVVPC